MAQPDKADWLVMKHGEQRHCVPRSQVAWIALDKVGTTLAVVIALTDGQRLEFRDGGCVDDVLAFIGMK